MDKKCADSFYDCWRTFFVKGEKSYKFLSQIASFFYV